MGRILIFLFVNGKCYGAQLQRSLKTALTPIQKALSRLENGGVIMSYYEGKTRVYQFNPAYPLLTELELLLKQAYTLLPAHEKKSYYVVREDLMEPSSQKENATQVLFAFWEKLMAVSRLTFNAKTHSKEPHGWQGKGLAEVTIEKERGNKVIFHEKGSWKDKQGMEFSFSNVFRWTLDRDAGVVSLEHLRRGPEHPTFLFHLAPSGKNSLASVDSHLCGGDTYCGQIQFDVHTLRLNWRVIGPKKNEEIDYYYS